MQWMQKFHLSLKLLAVIVCIRYCRGEHDLFLY